MYRLTEPHDPSNSDVPTLDLQPPERHPNDHRNRYRRRVSQLGRRGLDRRRHEENGRVGDDGLSEESRVREVMQSLDGSEGVEGGVEAALRT